MTVKKLRPAKAYPCPKAARLSSVFAGLTLMFAPPLTAAPLSVLKPAAKAHLDAAIQAAGSDHEAALILCNMALPASQQMRLPTNEQLRSEANVPMSPPPMRVFDNLYYLGIHHVSAWAVTTPAGIILFDTLDNDEEAQRAIEGGMRKLGLDPAQIKYIVLTHGHGDHAGGAQYLVDKYHPKVLEAKPDWGMEPDKPDWGQPPRADMDIADGQKLSLGGETITLYRTPGHTLGTVSAAIPVTDRGQPHMVAFLGGVGFNFEHTPARFKIYADSIEHLMRETLGKGADIALSNHPEHDHSFRKMDQLSRRGANDPNPFVVGRDGVRRFFTTYSECAQTYEAQLIR